MATGNYVYKSSFLQGLITSIGMLGAMLGSLTCFQIADELGRKRTLIVASVLFFFGSIVENVSGISSFDGRTGISILIMGRLLYGYGCGFAMHGAPAYIGEMAPSQIRGLLVSLKEGFVVLGMVLGYTIGYLFSETVGGWRYTYGFGSIISVIMLFGMIYLPYSARWLALKGRINEATLSLKFVTPNISESEIEDIKEIADKAIENQRNILYQSQSDWTKLTAPAIFPALVAGVGLVFLQQVTGQPSVLYYADSIFEDVGLDMAASIGVSVFKLFATLFATFTVDKYGRKLLLYIGCSLMLLALFILSIAFLFPYTSVNECNAHVAMISCPSSCVWDAGCASECSAETDDYLCTCCGISGINFQKSVILTALFIYIGGYQIGFGPISWLLISEIFPLEVRGKAVSIAVVTNFFWNTVMTFIFPIELNLIGQSLTFFIYAIVLIFAINFIYHRVPETKGLTLEEIEDFFLRTSQVNIYREVDKSNSALI
eukprot:gene17396-22945_t